MNRAGANVFLAAVFLAMLAAPAVVQTVIEARRGTWPQVLQFFGRRPTPAGLRAFEHALEDASVTIRTLRPWMQAAQFLALRDAGDKAIVGRDGWLFYGPGVGFLTQRPRPRDSTPSDALDAVLGFQGQLAERGIRLILMPAPNKESVYPEMLTRFASAPTRTLGAETRRFLEDCAKAGVEVVDLFSLYRDERATTSEPVYLAQDSHWSPMGMELAARAVADRILARDWVKAGPVAYGCRSAPISRMGDIVRMTRSPLMERRIAPESITCNQVIRTDTGDPYQDDPDSEVLVLGDSFLRTYQQDEPGQAGFVAHLARALRRPLASIIQEGGGSTLVRQELVRRSRLLARTKVVVWEFTERDLRLGTEGWQRVTLPPAPPPISGPAPDRTSG